MILPRNRECPSNPKLDTFTYLTSSEISSPVHALSLAIDTGVPDNNSSVCTKLNVGALLVEYSNSLGGILKSTDAFDCFDQSPREPSSESP